MPKGQQISETKITPQTQSTNKFQILHYEKSIESIEKHSAFENENFPQKKRSTLKEVEHQGDN